MSSILIKNAYIVSMVSEISRADLYIKDGIITEIGIIEKEADKVIDAGHKIVMPGFINAHTHAGMSIFRGSADDKKLMDWLQNITWPIEKNMSREDIYYASMLSIIEMIKSGTTTFCDHYFYEEETAKATEYTGIRAMLAELIIGDIEESKEKIKAAEELYNKWNDKANGRIKVCVGAHSPYTCSPETIKKSIELAQKLNIPYHIHYLETIDEIIQMKDKYNTTSTKYLIDNGALDCNLILAHGVQVTAEDIAELKNIKGGIVHCPISNQKLGSGIINLKNYKDAEIPVCIGTDGQGSTNTLDMFEEMKALAYMQKVTSKNPKEITAYEVLQMATIEGAKVISMEKEIGSLEVGKKADMIIISLDKPHLTPIHNIYSSLVYSANGADVETVIIDGKIIMENRKLINIDEEEIMQKVNQIVAKLF